MKVTTTTAISGTYEELYDVADDLGSLLEAVAANVIDLTPIVQMWLTAHLEDIELLLTAETDAGKDAA